MNKNIQKITSRMFFLSFSLFINRALSAVVKHWTQMHSLGQKTWSFLF